MSVGPCVDDIDVVDAESDGFLALRMSSYDPTPEEKPKDEDSSSEDGDELNSFAAQFMRFKYEKELQVDEPNSEDDEAPRRLMATAGITGRGGTAEGRKRVLAKSAMRPEAAVRVECDSRHLPTACMFRHFRISCTTTTQGVPGAIGVLADEAAVQTPGAPKVECEQLKDVEEE